MFPTGSTASGPNGADPGVPRSAAHLGRRGYDGYVRHTRPFLEASGGSIAFFGTGGPWFVEPGDERWDLVMLIRQASVAHFFAFASNEGYLAGIGHRPAALEDSRLLPVVERGPVVDQATRSRP